MGDTGLETYGENIGNSQESATGGPTGGPKTQEPDLQALAQSLQALQPEALAALLLNAIQSKPAAK